MSVVAFVVIFGAMLIYIMPDFEPPRHNVNVKRMSFQEQKEAAIRYASEEYKLLQSEGKDFSSGPCIAENIISGWSVDVVHLPRIALDDLSSNQCQRPRKSKKQHLIELSVDGDLVRVQ